MHKHRAGEEQRNINNLSHFFDHKLKGQPVAYESKVDSINAVIPGSKYILIHPFWQLLQQTDLSNNAIAALLEQFPKQIRDRLFTENRYAEFTRKKRQPKSPIDPATLDTSLDALTVWLCLLIEQFNAGIRYGLSLKYNIQAFRSFFRLFSPPALTPLAVEIYPLIYQQLHISMKTNGLPTRLAQDKNTPPISLPLFWQTLTASQIVGLIECYNFVVNLATQIQLINSEPHQRIALLYALNHYNFLALGYELEALERTPNLSITNLTEISRISTFLQSL
ncbi:hypothetical protein N5094_16625 [Shewanella putrefaciens]|uniref:hypothetical protein n=1 Tax=Shewanella putrefaciens TaxID=24 RepID=UPI0021C15162|nr:hypothetical protein [Shewanella putrefaciens]UXK08000.1 hypothetical protein N5094_16625 [Shewanella putrefaciens]